MGKLCGEISRGCCGPSSLMYCRLLTGGCGAPTDCWLLTGCGSCCCEPTSPCCWCRCCCNNCCNRFSWSACFRCRSRSRWLDSGAWLLGVAGRGGSSSACGPARCGDGWAAKSGGSGRCCTECGGVYGRFGTSGGPHGDAAAPDIGTKAGAVIGGAAPGSVPPCLWCIFAIRSRRSRSASVRASRVNSANVDSEMSRFPVPGYSSSTALYIRSFVRWSSHDIRLTKLVVISCHCCFVSCWAPRLPHSSR
mmetsp:Transcript_4123/g.11690  ORF Transcript_4123/g.11690 Transcript_4123/m.11690 type:complete len:249 (-) Transcript_4123:158-904(-)